MFSVSDIKVNAPAKRMTSADKVFVAAVVHKNVRSLVAPVRRKARVPSAVIHMTPAEYLTQR